MNKKTKVRNAARKQSKRGTYLIVNGDEWQLLHGVDDLACYPVDGESLEGRDSEFVMVDSVHRTIIATSSFCSESLGCALLWAIEISQMEHEREKAEAGEADGDKPHVNGKARDGK